MHVVTSDINCIMKNQSEGIWKTKWKLSFISIFWRLGASCWLFVRYESEEKKRETIAGVYGLGFSIPGFSVPYEKPVSMTECL